MIFFILTKFDFFMLKFCAWDGWGATNLGPFGLGGGGGEGGWLKPVTPLQAGPLMVRSYSVEKRKK